MPILAIPFVDQPPIEADRSRMDSRTLAFRDLDGNYPFSLTDGSFVFGPDAEGIDMPPREVITRTIPGLEGERLSEVRVGKREVFLPLTIRSNTHTEHLDARDRLARLFNHRRVDLRSREGTLDLVANSERGERTLRCVYVDGMTSGRAPNERAIWQKLGLNLWAVRPYWSGATWTTPTMRLPTPASFFGAFPPRLSARRVIGGTATVTVEGDVESWPVVEVVGPADSVLIEGDDFQVSIPDGLASGEPFRLVTDPRGRTALFSSVKDWTRMGPGDRYGNGFVPGDQELSVTLVGATTVTSVVIWGRTSWERPW
jgi:hypothetical protein